MSVQLDNLIAILRDSAERLGGGDACSAISCNSVMCSKCPLFTEESVHKVVEELEVLQHAKA